MKTIAAKTKLSAILLAGGMVLAACGGGGGGGGSSSGGGSSNTPTGRGLIAPASIAETIPENQDNRGEAQTFSITAPDTALSPTNFRLTGGDASSFSVVTSIFATGSPTVFDVELLFTVNPQLDFENPTDANTDNVYEFNYVFDYGQTTYTIPTAVTAQNVREAVTLEAGSLRFDAREPNEIAAIPDVTGDGLPDVMVEFFGIRNLNILSSEQIIAGKDTVQNLEINFDSSDFWSQYRNDSLGDLTALNAASGTGVDLFYSDWGNDFVALNEKTSADLSFLEGTVDFIDLTANGARYEIDQSDGQIVGELVPDLNGNGANDLFLTREFSNESGFGRPFGLVWGGPQTGEADNTRSGDFDVTFTQSGLLTTQIIQYIYAKGFPDIDGDGRQELMIVSPLDGDVLDDGSAAGAVWIVNSSHLGDAQTTEVDLDDLTTGHVRRIRGAPADMFASSVTFLETASETVVVFSSENEKLIYAINASDVSSLPLDAADTDLRGPGRLFTLEDENDPVNTLPVSQLENIGDIDGGGVAELYDVFWDTILFGETIVSGLEGEADDIEIGRDDMVIGFGVNANHVVNLSEYGLLGLDMSTSGGRKLFLLDLEDLEPVVSGSDKTFTVDELVAAQ